MKEKMNPVGWFEIPVKDMARAKAFYEYVLDLKLEDHEMEPVQMAWFPMSEELVGAAGSLVKGEGYEPAKEGVLIYFSTLDVNIALARVREKGGQVITGKTSIGEYGFYGVILDTEGNRIGVHSRE